MVKLNWNGKNESSNYFLKSDRSSPLKIVETYETTRLKSINLNQNDIWQNILIWGENEVIMTSLLPDFKEKIRLIYIILPLRRVEILIIKF